MKVKINLVIILSVMLGVLVIGIEMQAVSAAPISPPSGLLRPYGSRNDTDGYFQKLNCYKNDLF